MSEKKHQIECSYTSEASLHAAYMPFIKGGGLFIRTKVEFELGDEVGLTVNLFDELEPYRLDAKVVWITPIGAQGNKPPGIGVQFIGENSRILCNKIETYLAGTLKSSQATDTM